MYCSPTNLFVDSVFWRDRNVFDTIVGSFQNYTSGDPYDCALASVPCNSSINKGYSGSSVAHWFDIFVIYVTLPILMLLGVSGNVFNILIFSRNAIANDSTNNLLLCVSVVDLIISLGNGTFLCTMFMCFVDISLAITSFNLVILPAYRNFAWFSMLGLDIVTIMAVQRATAVIFPFHVSKIFSKKNTNIILVVLFSFTILTLIPNHFVAYARWVFHPYFNKYISIGYEYRIPHATAYVYIDSYLTYRSFIDLLVLVVSVAVTIVKLKKHNKTRSALKADNSNDNKNKMSVREKKTIRMSLAVSITTSILYAIPTVFSAIITWNRTVLAKSNENPIAIMFYYGGMIPLYFMACFNFFLYLVVSSQYRDIFISMFIPNKR